MHRAFAWPRFARGFVSVGGVGFVAMWVALSGGCGGGTSGTGQGGATGAAVLPARTAGTAAAARRDAATLVRGGSDGRRRHGRGGRDSRLGRHADGHRRNAAGAARHDGRRAGTTGAAGRGGTTGSAGATGGAGRGGTTGTAGTTGAAGRGGTTGSAGTPAARPARPARRDDRQRGHRRHRVQRRFLGRPQRLRHEPRHAGVAVQDDHRGPRARHRRRNDLAAVRDEHADARPTSISKSGTAAAHIRVQAVAGGTRPVLDFSGQAFGSSNRGLDVTGDYWEFRGLRDPERRRQLHRASAARTTPSTSWSSTAAATPACRSRRRRRTRRTTPRPRNNLVLNCDSYENLDQPTNGENADGFAAKLRIGPGNVFRGCRAWNNADDGWDFFASDDVVAIDNCWAFLNGKVVSGSNTAGDGNGFKLGGAPERRRRRRRGPHGQELVRVRQPRLRLRPQQQPRGPDAHELRRQRQRHRVLQLTSSPQVTITMTGAQGKAAVRNADGSLPAIH